MRHNKEVPHIWNEDLLLSVEESGAVQEIERKQETKLSYKSGGGRIRFQGGLGVGKWVGRRSEDEGEERESCVGRGRVGWVAMRCRALRAGSLRKRRHSVGKRVT